MRNAMATQWSVLQTIQIVLRESHSLSNGGRKKLKLDDVVGHLADVRLGQDNGPLNEECVSIALDTGKHILHDSTLRFCI